MTLEYKLFTRKFMLNLVDTAVYTLEYARPRVNSFIAHALENLLNLVLPTWTFAIGYYTVAFINFTIK